MLLVVFFFGMYSDEYIKLVHFCIIFLPAASDIILILSILHFLLVLHGLILHLFSGGEKKKTKLL